MNLFFDKIKYKKVITSGFTLVELMISVAVFSMAVVVGVGALYSAQQINIKLQSTHIIMDSVNLSLEVMTRNMRYGSSFYCVDDTQIDSAGDIPASSHNCIYDPILISSGGRKIVFKPVNGGVNDRIAYYLDNNKHLIESISVNGGAFTSKQISSDDIVIDNLRFYVTGANNAPQDTDQPMITVILSGKTKWAQKAQQVGFVLQSSVTSRN